MAASQRLSRGFLGLFLAASLLLAGSMTATFAGNIATCGESAGYGFYPKAGLAASQPESGKWMPDAIGNGRMSLTETGGEFDLLISDFLGGRIYSSKQEGATVIVTGTGDKSLSVVVAYRNLVETYTFLRNEEGQAEVMWTVNKWGTPIPKVGAYRADCSFFAR